MIGRIVSHYKVLERLAGGSMGVVYKAEDLGLRRTVALKFLSPELTRDVRARKRFTREARAASALDHPNICTVHEIDVTAEGQTFIAMAFYEGDTLKQRIRRGPVPVRELLDVVTQVASGLGKAHECGIVHRDVKPANVLITSEGLVKLLDFGLAKQITSHGDYLTQSGFAMGTPTYMSPEQALGETVDSRSDQWSLATIVYEALAGRAPFRGPSKMAVLFAIINRSPEPLTSERPDLPPEVDEVMARALSKNPGDRYGTIEEMATALRSALGEVDSEEAPPRAEEAPPAEPHSASETTAPLTSTVWVPAHRRRRRSFFVAGLAALTVVIAVGAFFNLRSPPLPLVRTARPLTRAPGMEQYPSFSPGGDTIAYVSEENGRRDVWLRELGSDRSFPVTDPADHDVYPVFSPDGESLAFASDRAGGGVFVMPAADLRSDVEPRQVWSFPFDASEGSVFWIPTFAWSPDSRRLAVCGTFGAPGLYTVDLAGGEPRTMPLPPVLAGRPVTQPAYSPDGRLLALTELTGTGISVSRLWLVTTDGAQATRVNDGRSFDHQPVFSPDGRHLFFVSNRGGIADVWSIRLGLLDRPVGDPRRVTVGIGIDSFAVSPDGNRIAYSKAESRANVYSFALQDDAPPVSFDEVRALTSENHLIEHIDVSPDGEWIAFDSDRGGNMDIWVLRRDGSDLRQLTTDPAHDWRPSFSPDGSLVVFYSMRSGNRDLYLVASEGERSASVVQLTEDPAMDWMPSFTPDGSEIVFSSTRSGSHDVWSLPTIGGEPRQLTAGEEDDRFPTLSRDGRSLAFARSEGLTWEIFLLDLDGGEPVRLTGESWAYVAPFGWSDDDATVYAYARSSTERPQLVAVSAADGTVRPLTAFRGPFHPFQSLAVHGSTLYFPVLEKQGDLWLAELGE